MAGNIRGSGPSDAELVALALQGDARGWEAVWRRHSAHVRNAVLAQLGPDSALDDIVQDTFVALHRSLERLERPEALRAFLLGTAFRLTAFELRTRSRRRRRLCLTSTGALPDVALEPPHRERDALRALDRVLSALEPEAREAFVLRHVEDAKAEEVATHLGVTPSKAKRLLARASSRVRLLAGRDAALAGYTAHARNLA